MRRPASDLVVRDVHAHEFQEVGQLTVAGYHHDGHLRRPDGAYDHDYAAWLADAAGRAEHATVLVALDGVRPVGTVTWCPHGSASAQLTSQPWQGEIRTLSVDPLQRGRGIGRTLVEACLDRARNAELTEVLLCSLTTMTTAHRLYVSMGFARRPELDWSPLPDVRLLGFSLSLDA